MKKNLLLISVALIVFVMASSCVMASTLRSLTPDGKDTSGWTRDNCKANYMCAIALDGDILKTSTVGALDLYEFSNIEDNAGDIEYVKVTVTAKQWWYRVFYIFDKLRVALKTNGRVVYGPIEDLNANWLGYSVKYEKNPVTGWDWNWQEVNNLKAGMKSEDGGKVDKIYITVKYDSVCGNEITEGSEVCDSNSDDCIRSIANGLLNYPGTHECDPSCQKWGICISEESCGDGILNGNEYCDGTDVGNRTCESLGYTGGTLVCDPYCLSLDISSCYH